MTPQIPEYVLSLESILRPFVMTIALGLIWLGAARMPASAKSRYTTAGVLSAVLLGWEAIAQYLGAANTYLATIENVATGIVAVVVAAQLGRNAIGAHRATYVWCLFGIADLVVAIAMGAMTSPGRVHLLALDAPNLLVTAYPLVMVPTFAVPLALMLHGLVLLRLQRGAASTRQLAAA
jgi:hypothetical protein